MRISEVARRSGVTAKTIRYYEEAGLIPPASRRDNGYRDYDDFDVHTLRFVNRARGLGFAVEDVASLLTLWRDRGRASADVRALAERHVVDIDEKIRQLQSIRDTLGHLVERCHGDDRPDCPIIEELAG